MIWSKRKNSFSTQDPKDDLNCYISLSTLSSFFQIYLANFQIGLYTMLLLPRIQLFTIASFLTITQGALATNSTKQPLDYQQRNLETIQRLYNTTIFPNNQVFLMKGSSAIPPGLFNMNATGRISPIGNFSGKSSLLGYASRSSP